MPPPSQLKFFKHTRRIAVACSVCCCAGALTWAVTPTPEEMARSRSWLEQAFHQEPGTTAGRAWMEILDEDVSEAITRGRSWRGTPYQIQERTYNHGIAFNSSKLIRVHLGAPGRQFSAEVGLENNDDTRRGATLGHGSVTFHVRVRDQEVFQTRVRRLEDAPVPVNVALERADEFEIRVGDGGDGRGWDQALWGGATVLLADGSSLRLQDLPWREDAEHNPFTLSFQYDGQASRSLLTRWTRRTEPQPGAPDRRHWKTIYTNPDTRLTLEAEVTAFDDFPAVEWVVHLENRATQDSPTLSDIRPLDAILRPSSGSTPILHWAKGAVASFDDFAPQESSMKPGTTLHLQPGGGRSSSQVLPFFNLAGPDGGCILGIGWSGEWAADFQGKRDGAVATQIGMARTHLRLRPGERIRTPRLLRLDYEGDRWRGQNLLRQFLLKHHRPELEGQPLVAPITCGNWGGTAVRIHLDNIAKIVQHDLPIDYYWIDAEWFGTGGWPVNVGNWQVKRELYPDGFRPLSQALKETGRELMLWFEPERVFRGTSWHQEHAAWLLDLGHDSLLYDLGNPEAQRFLTDFISDRIDQFGLGCYRQDFNIDPLPFWQKADAADRQGITEIRHIEGLYAFWDELLRRHPRLLIDNCASGGRRIDLETIGRATPFWRTDGPRDPIAHQSHTYGLLAWVPLSATSQDRAQDDYEFRSSMCSSLCLNWWVSGDVPAGLIRSDFPFDWARRTLEQYLAIRHYYYGDYYPLTGYSQATDLWMAYQLDRPDLGEGLVVVLKRPRSPYVSARFPLRALAPDTVYEIVDLDSGETTRLPGRDLVQSGIRVTLPGAPASALVRYRAG